MSASAASAGQKPPPVAGAGGPASLPTAADLRTAVNQVQSLLLLLDSNSDLVPPTSSSGQEGLISSSTPGYNPEALAAPATATEGGDDKAGNVDDDAASDSSDAPLMQQQQQQQQKTADAAQPDAAPAQPAMQGSMSQPGLSQVLPALLLPLQPATPVSIAQLNMSSMAMGFPNIMARYRGAVQHAFNLVVDLQRGMQMLSNNMPDPLDASRSREAPLAVAARLLRETESGSEQLRARMERVKKRQRLVAEEVEARKQPKVAQAPSKDAPKLQDPVREEVGRHRKRLQHLLSESAPALHGDATREGLEQHLALLEQTATTIAQDDGRPRPDVHITIARWRPGGLCHVRMTLASFGAAYLSFTPPSSTSTTRDSAAALVRITLRSKVEEAEDAALQARSGLATLAMEPSRFETFRALSQQAFSAVAKQAARTSARTVGERGQGAELEREGKEGHEQEEEEEEAQLDGPWRQVHAAALECLVLARSIA